jgi:hypothetical protein
MSMDLIIGVTDTFKINFPRTGTLIFSPLGVVFPFAS